MKYPLSPRNVLRNGDLPKSEDVGASACHASGEGGAKEKLDRRMERSLGLESLKPSSLFHLVPALLCETYSYLLHPTPLLPLCYPHATGEVPVCSCYTIARRELARKGDVMKEYPDPKHYLDAHLKRSAEHALNGFQQANGESSLQLTWAIQMRAIHNAVEEYTQEVEAIRDHNINEVIKKYKKQRNQIKRESGDGRLKCCLPLAILFWCLAWYSFAHSNFIVGIYCTIGSLAFLGILVLGAIFDRPS